MTRINKYLSLCGVTSRRGAEQLITRGKVTVNDKTIDQVGTIIDETKDIIKVNGTVVTPVVKKYYILLNKPKGVLTTLHDPFRRKTVAHFLRKAPARVYPVGRLDVDTEGVLILTNDGDMAYRLAHPKYQIPKVYEAMVKGIFRDDDAASIAGGIKLDDGHIGKGTTKLLSVRNNTSCVEITLNEGHKHEVKQLLKAVGHPVMALRRVSFAGLRAETLRVGRWRFINYHEIRHLKDLVGL
ncbi:MAG: rRNA pseudouridine synthase [candidate division Zixibacteria bacterium]|nr:rRNA pseudouridine synthase [candidate division Zixibacteria bacterium]